MAAHILAVSPHSGNPVSEIAHLIEVALQEHCDLSPNNNLYANYSMSLSTLIGLGFTTILAEGSRIRSCRPHLATFLRYRDFIRNAHKLEQISVAVAEITCSAIYPFRVLGFPKYYDDFILALVNTLSPSNTSSAKTNDGIRNILRTLFEQCH